MGKYYRLPFISKLTIALGIAVLGSYVLSLQKDCPIITRDITTIENARVVSIEEGFFTNDLTYPSLTYDLWIEGEERRIHFNKREWDETVEVGDTIDLKVREVPPVLGDWLDGLAVEDYK